ncbi:TlpA disulfide reductase family protein [Mangrovimonas sp. ST2L15]|uniref:TlpA family protein disulfide reductase n=1 Tax=Mangrovimonas sp. ST2L15 TaxID=1645916 RepID=UPI0006B4398C|nr:TlpA disulfide reductase family protein [Mangrovimonas sp. ST2L15]
MKKLFYLLVFAPLAFLSCSQETEKKDYVLINGTILNSRTNKLQFSGMINSLSKTVDLDSTGTFKDTLRIKAENLMVYDGSNLLYLYLEAGDDLEINYDSENFNETIQFKGVGSEINSYLISKRRKEKEVIGKDVNKYLLDESTFKSKQDEVRNVSKTLLDGTENLPEKYIEKERRNIEYTYLSNLSNYEANHAYYAKDSTFKVSQGFLKELDNFDYNREEDFLFSYAYYSLLNDYCKREANKLSEATGIAEDLAILKTYNTLSNQTIKDLLLYKKAQYGITYTNELEAYYEEFMKGSSNEEHKKEITNSYHELRKVAKGNPSPKFLDYENFKGGTSSLEDFKGKYIYIDVWATWCGPCKAEIPHLKRVEEKYHDKDIEFISISIDRKQDRDKWKKMVKDENLEGVQLMADNDFKSQFVQDYYIKGIPRFILLDPESNIIMANAPRPSNSELEKILEQLLD